MLYHINQTSTTKNFNTQITKNFNTHSIAIAKADRTIHKGLKNKLHACTKWVKLTCTWELVMSSVGEISFIHNKYTIN